MAGPVGGARRTITHATSCRTSSGEPTLPLAPPLRTVLESFQLTRLKPSQTPKFMNACGVERQQYVGEDKAAIWDRKDSGQNEPEHVLRFSQKMRGTTGHDTANRLFHQARRRTTNPGFPRTRNTSA